MWGLAAGIRARPAWAAWLLFVSLLVGCEAIGAPDAYRTQVCGTVRDLSGPLADAVTALEAAAQAHDVRAMQPQVDALKTIVDRMTEQLVDVPLWMSGVDVTTDLRALAAAYAAAVGKLQPALASGDQARIDAAVAALTAARQASPGLGDHLRTARLAGLNC